MQKFYGKYRGQVVSNVDPEQRGRIMVRVADVLGDGVSSWALPCVPVAGNQMGVFVLPVMGAGVWVEFEGGNPDYPIWTGGFWGSASEVPTLAAAGNPLSPSVVIQTTQQNMLVISDVPGPTGGVMIKIASGALISINDTGITISNGKGASIMMTGTSVNINSGAMVIT